MAGPAAAAGGSVGVAERGSGRAAAGATASGVIATDAAAGAAGAWVLAGTSDTGTADDAGSLVLGLDGSGTGLIVPHCLQRTFFPARSGRTVISRPHPLQRTRIATAPVSVPGATAGVEPLASAPCGTMGRRAMYLVELVPAEGVCAPCRGMVPPHFGHLNSFTR